MGEVLRPRSFGGCIIQCGRELGLLGVGHEPGQDGAEIPRSKQLEAVLPGETPIGGPQESWGEMEQLDGPLQPDVVRWGGLLSASGAEGAVCLYEQFHCMVEVVTEQPSCVCVCGEGE